MIGVASRKREACSLLVGESGEQAAAHRWRPSAIARDQGEGLRRPDAERRATAQPVRRSSLVVLDAGLVADGRAAPQRLGAEQHQAVEEEEDRRPSGGEANSERSGCSSSRPSSPPGSCRRTSSQPSFASAVLGIDVAVAQRAAESPDDAHPVAAEEAGSRTQRGRAVGRDQEASGSSRRSGGCPSRSTLRQDRRCARGSRSGRARRLPWSRPRTIAWKYEDRIHAGALGRGAEERASWRAIRKRT